MINQKNPPPRGTGRKTATEKVTHWPAGREDSGLFESAPIAFLTVDRKGIIERVNTAAVEMLQQPRRRLVGQKFSSLIFSEDLRAYFKGIGSPRKYAAGKAEKNFELRLCRKDDRILFARIHLRAEFDESHHLGCTNIAITDITQNKQDEEALRLAHEQLGQRVLDRTAELQSSQQSSAASEERFREMAENIEEVFWLAVADMSRILYVSPAFQKVWGRACEDLYQNPRLWEDAMHPEDRKRAEDAFPRDRAGKVVIQSEYRIARPDGEVRWIADHRFPVRNDAGHVYRIAGVARDITVRKKAEFALARANRALHAITESNKALLRASSETEMFNQICRIIVAVGGYRLAWVGMADFGRSKAVVPVAYAGYAGHYLDTGRISWADNPYGRGPAGTAIRTHKPAIMHDLRNHPGFIPWRRFLKELETASALGIPMLENGRCFAALTIFAPEPEAFDTDEVDLLIQVANDLAFGVSAIRARVARQRLERQILEISEREQRRIGQDLHDSLGQRIAAARFMSSALARQLAGQKLKAARDAAHIEKELVRALETTRQIARGLHPVKGGADSLMAALHELAEQITKMYRIPCRFKCHCPVLVSDHSSATHLYRIAQEASGNAARHGNPNSISISLKTANGTTQLRIEDDGSGLPAAIKPGKGLGLEIMRYRASVIGATLGISPRRGGGTVVTCQWNVP